MTSKTSDAITLTLHYATNRGHQGKQRFRPDSYGSDFSGDGQENLRFGKVSVTASRAKIRDSLKEKSDGRSDAVVTIIFALNTCFFAMLLLALLACSFSPAHVRRWGDKFRKLCLNN